MKSIKQFSFLLPIVLTVLLSCNQNQKANNNKIKDTSEKAVTRNFINADTLIENVPITPLPFGSKTLRTYKFPKTIETVDPLVDTMITSTGTNEKHFNTMSAEYSKIDKGKSFKGPEIANKSYTNLGKDSLIVADNRRFENDFKYRLPDMNKYECYYIYHDYMSGNYDDYINSPIQTSNKLCFLRIGSLVLYNRQTKSANIINVEYLFETGHDDFTSYARYFYIDKDKTIKIFDCTIQESVIVFEETGEINVLEDGKIVVKNLK